MKRIFAILALMLTASGCATITEDFGFMPEPEPAKVIKNENTEFLTLPGPSTGKAVVAVYGFTDKTGQRKPSERMANISTAVTQGAEVWLIKALQEVGGGTWFQVVERVGLENLTKERQIKEILLDALTIEREFITESLPISLIGMNAKLMTQ